MYCSTQFCHRHRERSCSWDLDKLQQFLIPQFDEDGQEGRIHFQQDGAPPHYLVEVREYLNPRFPGRWIGRAATMAWPPRFPDLTTPGFFLMGIL
jgi:hypothetical protein